MYIYVRGELTRASLAHRPFNVNLTAEIFRDNVSVRREENAKPKGETRLTTRVTGFIHFVCFGKGKFAETTAFGDSRFIIIIIIILHSISVLLFEIPTRGEKYE